MNALAIVGIVAGALVVTLLIGALYRMVQGRREHRKSEKIKDRLRRKTKPVPITGPRAMNPRPTEE